MPATLERYMTRHPQFARADESLGSASRKMASLGVRHLPVLDEGELVGIVSERDLMRVSGGERGQLRVRDVCIEDPLVVDIATSLSVVAMMMCEKRIGSVVVLEEGRLAGIFTTVDACRALADSLATPFAQAPEAA